MSSVQVTAVRKWSVAFAFFRTNEKRSFLYFQIKRAWNSIARKSSEDFYFKRKSELSLLFTPTVRQGLNLKHCFPGNSGKTISTWYHCEECSCEQFINKPKPRQGHCFLLWIMRVFCLASFPRCNKKKHLFTSKSGRLKLNGGQQNATTGALFSVKSARQHLTATRSLRCFVFFWQAEL